MENRPPPKLHHWMRLVHLLASCLHRPMVYCDSDECPFAANARGVSSMTNYNNDIRCTLHTDKLSVPTTTLSGIPFFNAHSRHRHQLLICAPHFAANRELVAFPRGRQHKWSNLIDKQVRRGCSALHFNRRVVVVERGRYDQAESWILNASIGGGWWWLSCGGGCS